MEFCVISPTAGLEKYATLSKTHLVLSHECKDHDYLQFYIRREMEGDFIILDNGGYEGKPHIDWNLIQGLHPDVIVLPDFYLQPWKKTWHAAIAWLDKNYDDVNEFECLYIPQAEPGDGHGFMQSYLEAVQDPRITWIGIPRALATDIVRDPLARVAFAKLVLADHPDLRLHAFGMVNGDVHELPYLAQAGVNSVDSSAPVWRGWRNLSLTKPEDRKWWDEHGMPVDFEEVAPQEHEVYHKQALVNLEACGVNTHS